MISSREAAEKLFAAWERWDLETVGSLIAENATSAAADLAHWWKQSRVDIETCRTS
jgi:hypothetical protein